MVSVLGLRRVERGFGFGGPGLDVSGPEPQSCTDSIGLLELSSCLQRMDYEVSQVEGKIQKRSIEKRFILIPTKAFNAWLEKSDCCDSGDAVLIKVAIACAVLI